MRHATSVSHHPGRVSASVAVVFLVGFGLGACDDATTPSSQPAGDVDFCAGYQDLNDKVDELQETDVSAPDDVVQLGSQLRGIQQDLSSIEVPEGGQLDRALTTLREDFDEARQAAQEALTDAGQEIGPRLEQALQEITAAWGRFQDRADARCATS